MPRIPPSAIRQAHRISPHAAHLLPVCRDLPSAVNEARWIREHARERQPSSLSEESEIERLCQRRARGEPLQYVLGTQPFGNLEVKCRPGVLIPRPEPEAYTTYLANLILQQPSGLLGREAGRANTTPSSLRILDLCTGTGCIALLFYSLLHRAIPALSVRGVDISPHAVKLAEENVRHNIRRGVISPPSPTPGGLNHHHLEYSQGDIFSDVLLESLLSPASSASLPSSSSPSPASSAWDILVCNPPYISHRGFARDTARSVRNYEPKLAQVPMVTYPGDHEPEDAFYARLLDIGARLRPRIMLFEVGGLEQAGRVATMALRHGGLRHRRQASGGGEGHFSVEIWRDWPDAMPGDDEQTFARLGHDGEEVRIRGSGHGRSVLIQCPPCLFA